MSISESRRLVTVLFSDVTDSTGLASTLDAESMRDLMTRFYEGMRDVATRHGGTVEKFVGDAMLVVFGIPLVHEDDALRATRAAVDMRAVLERLNEKLRTDYDLELETRTALASGEVVAGADRDGGAYVTGPCVNLAARLQQVAEPGGILLSSDTRGLVRDAVVTEPVNLSLKGFDGDVEAHRLLEIVPGAAGHARRSDSPLVDRAAEMTLLPQMFARAVADRRCHLITVVGAAGVGKSRLVDELVAHIGERARVLTGRCLPYGEGITFHPIAEAIDAALGIRPKDPPETVRRKILASLTDSTDRERISQLLARVIGVEQAFRPQGLEEVMWALGAFFASLAAARPLVLVFDDIHWGEVTFFDVIAHLSTALTRSPVVIACTARPELLEVRGGWGGGQVNATTINLEALGSEDADQLIRHLLRELPLDADVRRNLARAAGGNPLFAEEIVSALIQDGTLVAGDEAWTVTRDITTADLPPTIAGLIGSRLDRLAPDERELLSAASVIGRDFMLAAAVDLVGGSGTEGIQRLVGSLERKDLIRPVQGVDGSDYRFRHLLIRDVTYGSLPKRARAEMHERFAGWMEANAGDRLEELREFVGYHLERAHDYLREMGRRGEHVERLAAGAGRQLVLAGRKAASIGDMPATASLLGRADALLPSDDPEMLLALPDLADSLYQAGEAGRADGVLVQMLVRAEGTGDRALVALAQQERSSWQIVMSPASVDPARFREVTEGAIAVFQDLEAIEHLPSAFESLALSHRLFTGDITAMLGAAERGLDTARATGNPQAVSATLLQYGRALVLGPIPCDEALVRLEGVRASVSEDRMLDAVACLDTATLLGMLGRLDEAAPRIEWAREVFEELGQRRWMAEASAVAGEVARFAGDPEGAERCHRAEFDAYGRGEGLDAQLAMCGLGLALCDLERYGEAAALFEQLETGSDVVGLELRVGRDRLQARLLASRDEWSAAGSLLGSAQALVAPTELLSLRGELELDLARVLAASGHPSEATARARSAMRSFEEKRSAVAVGWARSFLDAT